MVDENIVNFQVIMEKIIDNECLHNHTDAYLGHSHTVKSKFAAKYSRKQTIRIFHSAY